MTGPRCGPSMRLRPPVPNSVSDRARPHIRCYRLGTLVGQDRVEPGECFAEVSGPQPEFPQRGHHPQRRLDVGILPAPGECGAQIVVPMIVTSSAVLMLVAVVMMVVVMVMVGVVVMMVVLVAQQVDREEIDAEPEHCDRNGLVERNRHRMIHCSLARLSLFGECPRRPAGGR